MSDLARLISDTYLAQVISQANALKLGFVEAAVGMYERIFQVVEIQHPTLTITAQERGAILRQLMTNGNAVCKIDMTIRDNAVRTRLLPCSDYQVWGDSPSPDRWTYDIQMQAPNSLWRQRYVQADGVTHFRINTDYIRPWVGQSPLQKASLTADVIRLIEVDLQTELKVPIGRILVLPEGSSRLDFKTGKSLKSQIEAQIAELDGGIVSVETTQAGYGLGPSAAPRDDYNLVKIGPEFSGSILQARESLAVSVLAAFGIPSEIVLKAVEAGAQREAWRRFLFSTVRGLGNVLKDELSLKLESQVELDYTALSATDLQGRARAYKQLIDAGMRPEKAEEIAAMES